MTIQLQTMFNRARIDDRQINELLGLSHGLTADGKIDHSEAEYLQKWLVANTAARDNPVISNLMVRINAILSDGVLNPEESQELFETLKKFSGGDFEIGELLKSTSLPFDQPEPPINFHDESFCFTGTFAFGTRKDCEKAISEMGGRVCSLTASTNFLVIGIYATDSWAHSSYGRKIEKAVDMKAKGQPIAIIGEQHWRKYLKL